MAECQDRHLTTAAIDFITARAAGISDNLDAQTSTRILESSYHTHLFQLFEKEFCSPPTKPASSSVYPSDLPRRRNDAAVCASNQRIGNKCYNARQLFSAHSQLPPDQHPPNDQLNKSSDDESAGEDLPTSFVENNEASNEPMQRFTQALQWPRRLAQALFAHPPPVPLGATLEPCPWLEATEKGSFLPHFLWDVSKRETVKVSPLKEVPEYTAVSHTWGRWRLRPPPDSPPGSPPPPPLPVDNVPWPVPQNSLFNVQDLPEILSTVPGGSPFVWFDLVCIPQVPREDTKSELAKLKRQEVARQASIFSRAKHSVVWFSDVVNFQALQIAVYWMSLYLLEHPQHNGLDVDATFAAANDAAGRLPQPPTSHILTFDSSVRRGWKEHGWLSSLWTLQEACLRPDMWICDKGFHVLNANGTSPLSLDELLALAKGCSGRFVAGGTKIVERQPGPANFQAAFEAIICLGQTGMTGLNNVSPLSILWLGDQRKCTDRSRAPATMSAIGTTDWYGPDDGRSDRPESPLILGRYPPEFVREVRQKFKAIFFALRLLNNQNPTTTLPIDLTPVGSMLPFGDRPAMMKVDTVFELTLGFVPQHPSVETWEVQNNGTVHVREAGIMASSTVQGDALEDLEVFIYALDPNTVTPTEKARGMGLGRYLCDCMSG
jgi:hypothetical protein